MEDYHRRGDPNRKVNNFSRLTLLNDKNVSFKEVNNENAYTKVFNPIDPFKAEHIPLRDTIKYDSNQKSDHSLISAKSTNQLKGVIMNPPDGYERRMIQLEQENNELKKFVSEFKKLRKPAEIDKRVALLEQENTELKKTLNLKSEQALALQGDSFRQSDRKEIEILEKNNKQLKKQVENLSQNVENITRKLKDIEEENIQIRTNRTYSSTTTDDEKSQAILKFMNYILNTINSSPPNASIRTCFEERFSNNSEVNRLLNLKDYTSLLLKSLKYISDLLITNDPEPKLLSPKSQDILPTPIIIKKNEEIPMVKSIKKPVGNTRASTPQVRSNNMVTPILSGRQTPSGHTGQLKKYADLKRQGRPSSQDLNDFESSESHVIYNSNPNPNPKPKHAKKLSLVPGDGVEEKESTAMILNMRRGSKTSRGIERTALDLIEQEEMEYRRKEEPVNRATIAKEKQRFLNEKEEQLSKLDMELQEKERQLKDLSIEIEKKRSGRNTAMEPVFLPAEQRGKSHHKRVNTADSCLSSKLLESELEGSLTDSRHVKVEEVPGKPVLPLKPILKDSTYCSRNDNNKAVDASDYESGKSNSASPLKNRYTSPKKVEYEPDRNVYVSIDSPKREIISPERDRGNSPPQRYGEEFRARLKAGMPPSDSSYQNEDSRTELDRRTRRLREEEYPQRFAEEDRYQPKVVQRPQLRDKPDEINVSNNSLFNSNTYSRNRVQAGLRTPTPLGDFRFNQINFNREEVSNNDGQYERKSSRRNLGSFRSPANSSAMSQKGGSNYTSFQVAFGRTENKTRISPSPQENRSKSPSIIDVHSKKRVEHVDQTYHVIRGQEYRTKKE